MMNAGTLAELVGLHAWIFALLLLPGFAFTAVFLRGRIRSPERLLACALCASGSIALVVFYATVLNPIAGRAASWLVMGLGAGGTVLGLRQRIARLDWRPLLPPLQMCILAGIFYSGILFLYGGFESASELAMRRYLPFLPADSVIPLRLAERLASGGSLHPFFGDWLSSDRPPLQAAFFLMIWPFVPKDAGYQIMATILQTWAFLAVWLFLNLARVPQRATAWVLSFVVFSGFTLLNATFVWPKLLAAGFLLIAAACLLYGDEGAGDGDPTATGDTLDDAGPARSKSNFFRFITLGACAGLAMMSHGGSAFGLIALGVFAAIFRRRLISVRSAGVAVAAFLAFQIPWSAYQRLCDPPGNRLLKWHLAGVIPIDSRSFPQALIDSYKTLSLSQWLHNKGDNVRTFFTDDGPNLPTVLRTALETARSGRVAEAVGNAAYWARIEIMFHTTQSLGVLTVGILALAFTGRRRGHADPALTCARECLTLGGIGLAVWCLLMFVPGSTVNHQGSYFINLCLMVAGGLGLWMLPRPAAWGLAVVNGILVIMVWAVAPRIDSGAKILPPTDPLVAIVGGIAVLGTLFALKTLARARP